MTEGQFFFLVFVVWFTLSWVNFVRLPYRMRRRGMGVEQSGESGEMPASANMAMWQTMGD